MRNLNRRFLARMPEGSPGLTVRNADDGVAEVLLYDEIGYWGITASAFARTLALITAGKIRLRINSPGGDVFDGLAMLASLRAHPAEIEVIVEGLAASAATLPMLAGDTITVADTGMVMIHRAWSVVVGNTTDMAEMSAVLDKIDNQLAEQYAAKTGKPVAEMLAAMTDETWMTAAEAVAFGIADAVGETGSGKAKALINPGTFLNTPADLIDNPDAQTAAPKLDVADENRIAAMRRRLRIAEAQAA